jgi:hypothetical protein
MPADRRQALASLGFSAGVIDSLIGELSRPLPDACPHPATAALGNELFVPDWIECCLDAHRRGALAALQDRIFELSFPIAGGISGTPEYQSLALAGHRSLEEVRAALAFDGPAWESPASLRVFLHDTGAGLLPVIQAGARADFVTLVRAIGHRNEPVVIPASMGSNFVNGYVNRRRYLRVREALAAGLLAPESRDPQLWKDKFLLLASGPYSGVFAESTGLTPAEWIDRSTLLRLHHESCHYLVRRLFPKLVFGIQDELVADFAGLMAATGGFRAADFLLFMGLERFPEVRAGGRMANYHRKLTADPELGRAVALLLVEAARNLERYFAAWDDARCHRERLHILAVLTYLPLETLAAPHAAAALDKHLAA